MKLKLFAAMIGIVMSFSVSAQILTGDEIKTLITNKTCDIYLIDRDNKLVKSFF